MDIRKLQRAIVDGLEDVKGQNIVVYNTEALSPLFERVIIASGTSNRQTKALAASVRDAVKALGEPVPRVEGEDNGEWIIVDCGAAVAHIMQPAIRDYYHLEEIWGVKPVTLRTAARRTGLPKAEEPAAPVRAAPARRASPRRAEAPVAAPDAVEPPVQKTRRASATGAGRPARKTAAAAASSATSTGRTRAAPAARRGAASAAAPSPAVGSVAKASRKRSARS